MARQKKTPSIDGDQTAVQTAVQTTCTACGKPCEVLVYLAECKTPKSREERKQEALADARCGRVECSRTAPKPEEGPVPHPRVMVSTIEPDPNQPRKHFDTADIEASLYVDQHGVPIDGRDIMQPLQLIWSDEPPYRIKDGERRWRAAKAVGLFSVSAYFVPATAPDRVLADQVKAGLTSQGLRPLEAADAIQRLSVSKRPPSAEDLASRIGLTARKVHQYRRLAVLAPPAREALDRDEIGITAALELATLDSHADQTEALTEAKRRDLRSLRRHIEERYHRRLDDNCGFDPADADVVPMAGPCMLCPKNTLTQRSLWSDSEDKEARCTDKLCFAEKKESTWQRRVEAAKRDGIKVIEGDEAQKLYPTEWGDLRSDTLIDLDDECPHDGEVRSWREVLDNPGPSVLVRAHDKVHELMRREAIPILARAKGLEDIAACVEGEKAERPDESPEIREPSVPERPRERTKDHAALWAKVTAAAQAYTIDVRLLRFLCGMLVRGDTVGDVIAELAEEHGLQIRDDVSLEKQLLALIATWGDLGQLTAFLVSAAVRLAGAEDTPGDETALLAACRFFGVDAAEPSTLEKAQCQSSGQGICRVCRCTELSPCEDGCAWTDQTETLCSLCALAQEEILDILTQKSRTEENTIAEFGEDHDRYRAAIAELLRTEQLMLIGKLLYVPKPQTCRICGCDSEHHCSDAEGECTFVVRDLCSICERLTIKILALCEDKPRQGPQIKAGCRDWQKERVHQAIKVLTAEGALDKDASGFSSVRR